MKLKALMEAVMKDKIFGEVVAHVRVVEFQKRGLPHAHCIFIPDQASKNALRNPTRVDTVISAELPSEDDDELRELVLQHMVQNPCGSHSLPQCAWDTGGARRTFSSLFDPRHSSLRASTTYRTSGGVQKKKVSVEC